MEKHIKLEETSVLAILSRATIIPDIQSILEDDPPKIPRKFLPRSIRNEDAQETEIPQTLAIEKSKTETNLLKIRLDKYRWPISFSEKILDVLRVTQEHQSTFEELNVEVSLMKISHFTSSPNKKDKFRMYVFLHMFYWFVTYHFISVLTL